MLLLQVMKNLLVPDFAITVLLCKTNTLRCLDVFCQLNHQVTFESIHQMQLLVVILPLCTLPAKPRLLMTRLLALYQSDTYSYFTFGQVFHHLFSNMPNYRDIQYVLSWQIILQFYVGISITSLKVYLFCCHKYTPAHLNTTLYTLALDASFCQVIYIYMSSKRHIIRCASSSLFSKSPSFPVNTLC